jgi:hypothetical protein
MHQAILMARQEATGAGVSFAAADIRWIIKDFIR